MGTAPPGNPVKHRGSCVLAVLESPLLEAGEAVLVPEHSLLEALAGHSEALELSL